MKCYQCGGNNAKRETREHRFVESGLSDVTIENCEFRVCADCGEESLVIHGQQAMHDAIAKHLIVMDGALAPAEIRFLREHVRLSNQQVADHLGVTPEQASRWATGGNGERMSAVAEEQFRAIVLHTWVVSVAEKIADENADLLALLAES